MRKDNEILLRIGLGGSFLLGSALTSGCLDVNATNKVINDPINPNPTLYVPIDTEYSNEVPLSPISNLTPNFTAQYYSELLDFKEQDSATIYPSGEIIKEVTIHNYTDISINFKEFASIYEYYNGFAANPPNLEFNDSLANLFINIGVQDRVVNSGHIYLLPESHPFPSSVQIDPSKNVAFTRLETGDGFLTAIQIPTEDKILEKGFNITSYIAYAGSTEAAHAILIAGMGNAFISRPGQEIIAGSFGLASAFRSQSYSYDFYTAEAVNFLLGFGFGPAETSEPIIIPENLYNQLPEFVPTYGY